MVYPMEAPLEGRPAASLLVAAHLCPPVSENSHRGYQLSTAILHPGIGFVNSNRPTGLDVCLYDDGRGSRSTGKKGIRNQGSITLGRGTTGVRWGGLRARTLQAS